MRHLPFPAPGERTPEEAWQVELDAMLAGDRAGAEAASWRELCADVRTLAPAMTPEFEIQLSERIAKRAAPARSAGSPPRGGPDRPHWIGRLHRPGQFGATAGALLTVTLLAAALVVGIVALPHLGGGSSSSTSSSASSARANSASSATAASPRPHPDSAPALSATVHGAAASPSVAAQGAEEKQEAVAPAATASGSPAAPGRKQQLAASISLSPTPGEVQATADRVAQLVASDGGYVQSSHVQVQKSGASEASLSLKLPSAKLSAALASLGQLAPVGAESQSLQDITSTYDSARRRLADATAERQALLHALSLAVTQGQIDSLRERLAQSRTAIAEAASAVQAVSRRSSTAEVEVTVLGDPSAGSEGLTLHRGLHDAGRVLTVTLVVLLVAAAILVPLGLLLLAGLYARHAWRRRLRERTLDAP